MDRWSSRCKVSKNSPVAVARLRADEQLARTDPAKREAGRLPSRVEPKEIGCGFAGRGAQTLSRAPFYGEDRFGDFLHIGGFTSLPAVWQGREVRTVRLEHELVQRCFF